MEKKKKKNGLSLSYWPWPSCKHPRTNSFRASVFGSKIFEYPCTTYELEDQEERISSQGFFTSSEDSVSRDDAILENLIKQARSDRLFFDPGTTATIATSDSSMSYSSSDHPPPVPEGSVAVELDSEDVYEDFRASIEEIVICNGGEGVEWLEGMLAWYLKANEKSVHGEIISAFVDVLVMKLQAAAAPSLMSAASSDISNSSSYSCNFSSCSSSTLLLDQD